MPARFLLDTNICIYALSGRHPELRGCIDRLPHGRVVISVVVFGELHFGIAKSAHKHDALVRLEAFMTQIPVHTMPPATAEHYGDIRATLSRQGKPIGANDLWIAAHARAAGLTLVSNNLREFQRVDGLKLENWA